MESGKISLGTFVSTSDFSALAIIAQTPEFKKAGIDEEVCVSFTIEDLKITGLAFPSTKDGAIHVGIYAVSTISGLPKRETSRQKRLFPRLENEVRKLVAEAYNGLSEEIYQAKFFKLDY